MEGLWQIKTRYLVAPNGGHRKGGPWPGEEFESARGPLRGPLQRIGIPLFDIKVAVPWRIRWEPTGAAVRSVSDSLSREVQGSF